MQDVIVLFLHQSKQFEFAQQFLPPHFSTLTCFLWFACCPTPCSHRQFLQDRLLSLTLIRRNALAMAKLYISHTENAFPISLQISVWLCRTFLLQASISCEKNSSEEQIILHAWCWSWHLVANENYLHNWMYCIFSESDEMLLGARSFIDAKHRMMQQGITSILRPELYVSALLSLFWNSNTNLNCSFHS